jgi:hypothetical protein
MNILEKYIKEHIVSLGNGKHRLLSHKGKNLGTFDSKAAAEKHEREVEYFKHQSESTVLDRCIAEMSDETLLAYRRKAKEDSIAKMDTDRKKSISRAQGAQLADIKMTKEEVVLTRYLNEADKKPFASAEKARKAVPSKGHHVVMQHVNGHHEIHSFKHEPEDKHLDKLARKLGHKNGGEYPEFTHYHDGEEVGGGGGHNSGTLGEDTVLTRYLDESINRKKMTDHQSEIHSYMNEKYGKTHAQATRHQSNATVWKTSIPKEDAEKHMNDAGKHLKSLGYKHEKTAHKQFYTDPKTTHTYTKDGSRAHVEHWHSSGREDHLHVFHAHQPLKEDAVPTNAVGGGAIAGATGDPPGGSTSKLIRRLKAKKASSQIMQNPDSCNG